MSTHEPPLPAGTLTALGWAPSCRGRLSTHNLQGLPQSGQVEGRARREVTNGRVWVDQSSRARMFLLFYSLAVLVWPVGCRTYRNVIREMCTSIHRRRMPLAIACDDKFRPTDDTPLCTRTTLITFTTSGQSESCSNLILELRSRCVPI